MFSNHDLTKLGYLGAALLLGVAACAGPAGGAATDDGLVILERDADGVRFTYGPAASAIVVETHRGPALGEAMRAEPGAPTHEIDLRVIDAAGNLFLWQMGGHDFAEPSWIIDPDAEATGELDRVRDLQLTLDAIDALAASPLAGELAPELDALRVLTAGLDGEPMFRSTAAPRDIAALARPPYAHHVEVHAQPCGGCGIFGDHSAVLWKSFDSGGLVAQGQSCNHGACAGAMARKCSASFGGRPNMIPPFQECTTPYDAASGAGGHNCNDDSELQVANVRNNRNYNAAADLSCNRSGWHNFAPGC